VLDLTASEVVEKAEQDDRIARIGGNSIIVDWLDNTPLAAVPAGQFHDRVMDWLKRSRGETTTVQLFTQRNAVALRQFWGISPGDALNLKKELEKASAEQVTT
jgi:hypothetical protein